MKNKTVYIVSAVRTPIGSFGGSLKDISATKLGATAIQAAVERAGIKGTDVDEVLMGCVLQANLGQAPARQAAKFAGLPDSVVCTTINKVCASGMKAITQGAQAILLGDASVVVAGGMENMSSVPFYAGAMRWGNKYGDTTLTDGLSKDGLTDVYHNYPMGNAADLCAQEIGFSREEQDAFAIRSYKNSAAANENGIFANEIVSVTVPQRRGEPLIIKEDEEYKNVKFEKIPQLRAAFSKDGTVTAANASTINDGASALILASTKAVKKYNLKPIAKILSFADAAQEPQWFTTAPTIAAPKALKLAKMNSNDVDFFEVNEAFSVVPLAFNKILDIDINKVNVHGGAVSMGHPLGASGARIVTTLSNVLQSKNATVGCAVICNGGGGASSIVIEKL